MGLFQRALNIGEGKQFRRYEKRVELINAFAAELEHDDDDELRERFAALHADARGGADLDAMLPEVFAIAREMSGRVLGMRHFDVQLVGGQVLHDGNIAEMKTGEGKTLTGTLALILNAMAGKGVHVVTVNDYLAQRDAEWMAPLYRALGLTVGVLQNDQDHDAKRAAYGCDITYGTNSEFGFDYLRDNMAQALEEKVQHGGRMQVGEDGTSKRPVATHSFAIVDEVDNILIDEARTPLIISGQPEQAADLYTTFARLARTMVAGKKPENLDPRQKKSFVADYDFEFDEKHKTVSVTEAGVEKAERFLGIDHLYRAENGHLVNHLQQALKAESLYKRDVDYAVVDAQVKIVDEHTGRILDGRRWSEGLHQAVEAKEGVAVQEENQTLAQVTLQNFFRMYDKLAGMTGTALTEATEFMKIYGLGVVEIPTNRPVQREDGNDQVFKTREGKWTAVEKEIADRNHRGQPVLVGTISVEISELLSERLRKRGISHAVLNAKPEHAAREADIIAEAGRAGGVTIATNMAGRGVDIKLGGSAEHKAEVELRSEGLDPFDEAYPARHAELTERYKAEVLEERERVLEAGGLCIIGTERHESRRIDNQLRGRAGRQGDPGTSRFFLSAEDDLVRIFAGDRIYRILDRFGAEDEDGNEAPIEASMLTKQIEKAQKRVEEQNYLIRKRVLEYDDVMNEQRRRVYEYRDQILEGRDMSPDALRELAGTVERAVDEYLPVEDFESWDVEGLFASLEEIWPVAVDRSGLDPDRMDRDAFVAALVEDSAAAYARREEELGAELMRQLERFLLLGIIDQRWREHLYDMDYLREGIHLRGFAQIEPIVAYKGEAFTLFEDLMRSLWSDYARMIFQVEVEVEDQPSDYVPLPSEQPRSMQYSGGTAEGQPSALGYAAAGQGVEEAALGAYEQPDQGSGATPVVTQRRVDEQEATGRNAPCWCGSGKKYKKCHGASTTA